MDRFKIRPLKTIQLKSRPTTTHAIAWSCDAELAVATDETIYIFIPDYPKPKGVEEGEKDEFQQQSTMLFRASSIIRPDPMINGQLCASAGVKLPSPKVAEDVTFKGVGNGLVTGSGASVCQVVRLEWSANGLGCNLRSVLTALATNGCLVALGENIDRKSTMISGMRTRGFKSWKVLWGLGASMPLPDSDVEGGYRNMNERIMSFSWAKEILSGRGLLAFINDNEEIAIMSVQYCSKLDSSQTASEEESGWEIREVARFDGRGVHTKEDATDVTDPDFVPHGTAFALKWSPWHVKGGKRQAYLTYLAKNYVGFRKVTIERHWIPGQVPNVKVEETDSTSICMFLATDAFIELEQELFMEEGLPMVRGVIGTPFQVKPFKVSLDESPKPASEAHYTWECSTTYSADNEASTNPITGLTIPRRDPSNVASVPYYSLVRLSATSMNHDWFQTNVPEESAELPQWAQKIGKQTNRLVSRATALEGVDTDSDESDYEMMDEDGDTAKTKVHPFRYRIWGMALSPGGGATVALVSQHRTQHPDRRSLAKLVFGWTERTTRDDESRDQRSPSKLTTEGQLWEWMYGDGPEVLGATMRMDNIITGYHGSALRTQFKDVIPKQRCVFCDAPLHTDNYEAKCVGGHTFAICAATGLTIMAPDISRKCAVCELRCLKVSELVKIAEEHLGPGTVVESTGESCGGCGGKFVA